MGSAVLQIVTFTPGLWICTQIQHFTAPLMLITDCYGLLLQNKDEKMAAVFCPVETSNCASLSPCQSHMYGSVSECTWIFIRAAGLLLRFLLMQRVKQSKHTM